MRLSWLVLACLAVLAGHAQAKRAVPCSCPTRIVLPERDATELPSNAKHWDVHPYGPVHYPARVPTEQLMGVTVTSDTTAMGPRDDTPPAAPRDVKVEVGLPDSYEPVASLSLQGQYAPDTALVRVDIRDDAGTVSMMLSPQRLELCDPGFWLAGRILTVEIRSIDLAGNESEPFITRVLAEVTDRSNFSCTGDSEYPAYHHRCGLIVIVYFLIGVPILLVWLLFIALRNAGAKRHPPEVISRLVAEGVVRRMRRWYVVWAAMLVVGAIGLRSAGSDGIPILMSPFVMTALYRLHRARRIQRMLDQAPAVATRRGAWLFVETPSGYSGLRASTADFAQAERAGVPTSIAR